ncbi:hypothetical protein fnug_268 [Pseudomonas phage fnug]|uniref:PHIKZ230.2 n=6 Tax=Viruses TaxID=10239 RepID=L7T0M0_BPDPK|nr:hypothetical protein FDI90_gp131 [Pseudomonas phage PA7]YP_009619642.1 hypothetical protein FDJ06_gp102 [Pseudomonas phage SL2]YP_009639929.1 PHIKZ230.2 [Pseudomonas phage phiKZ]ANM45035.1 hypothetical protein KTN4_277 [Pseudomonas phage KTN4]QJB22911.1 hypothetical protein fnug_268 [Pseudomonas phage fnug]QOV08123.1 hypothetical protein [Pseudomonas phage vB_PaeM_kmuB]QYV98941.1 hypothetical protein [Pseudomonas phage T2P]QYV99433.1 hypothetical protein [Pseudomonas phage U1B]QYV99523.1
MLALHSLLLLVIVICYIIHKWLWYTFNMFKLKDIIKNKDNLTNDELLKLLIDKIKAT